MTSSKVAMQPADRQALSVMQAIRDVAANLERRRETYRRTQDHDHKVSLRNQLLCDIDRLSNLVCLLKSIPPNDLSAATHRVLEESLTHLRNRISHVGANLTLDKIRELRSVAEGATRRKEHPLGKSYVLREDFVRYFYYLRSLVAGLTPENSEDLMTSAISINTLIESDRRSARFPSFSNDPEITLIDLAVLVFDEIEDEAVTGASLLL